MGMLGWVVAAAALLLVGVTNGQQQPQGDYSYDYNYVDSYDIPAGDSSGRSKLYHSVKIITLQMCLKNFTRSKPLFLKR